MVALIEKPTVVKQRYDTPNPHPDRALPIAEIAVPFAGKPRSTHNACRGVGELFAPSGREQVPDVI